MSERTSQKTLIMRVLDILKQYSDEDHRLSQNEIISLLSKEYGINADRKAIKRNLIELLDLGYEIEYTETQRKSSNEEENIVYSDWYINREFTNAELRLLIDSLLFSKNIPYSQCKSLIEKLKGLSGKYFEAKVGHIKNLPENLPENRELFFTIDVLDEAITKKKQVSFNFIEYSPAGKPGLVNNDDGSKREYRVSPYQMVGDYAKIVDRC